MNHKPDKPCCEALISLFPDPFVVINRSFQIVAANQKYKNHYRAGLTYIIGRHCYEISHGIDHPCSDNGEHCPLEEVIATVKSTSVMHIHCTCSTEEPEDDQILLRESGTGKNCAARYIHQNSTRQLTILLLSIVVFWVRA